MTRLAAVIGSPVRQSLSPVLHNSVFASSGLDWRFVSFEIVAGGVRAAIEAMGPLDIGGFAVTMPHKQAAASAVDEVDPAAAALDSVNTVVLRSDGSTLGASTDGAGFVDCIGAAGFDLTGARIVVVGAGAAARSIVDALGRSGAAHITIVNRTAAAAQRASALAPQAEAGPIDATADATLLVNATSVGMGDDAMPVAPSLLRSDLMVADIVYHPLETSLLAAARRIGAPVIDGLGMLVHQAILQQRLWTGVRPEADPMRAAAEAELARREFERR
ncbi:MAG: shikimate dehydrogenase [Ilumatobacteraceae bacterium]